MAESRPVLLAANRKIRHLRGVYLRNVTFDPSTGTARDDWALTAKAKNSNKLRVPDASNADATTAAGAAAVGKLPHARSSDDLVRDAASGPAASAAAGRRNTALFAEMAPSRHKKLQTTIAARLADVFISLHSGDDDDEPIYISETILKRMNFNFRFFDLKHHDSRISRSPLVTVKVWARRQNSSAWIYLLQDQIDLRTLTFLPALENHHFPANALIFHLSDGAMYTFGAAASPPTKPRQTYAVPTSSYPALIKLSTLEASIQDADATQDRLAAQIDHILAQHPADPVPLARERADIAATYLVHQRRALHAAQRKVHDLRTSIAARRAAMAAGRAAQQRVDDARQDAMAQLTSSRGLLKNTRSLIHGQRRRIAADLCTIFRIDQIPGAPPLSFQIRGVPLPNTTSYYDGGSGSGGTAAAVAGASREETLSAGLGFAALLVNMLQFYLGVPLPYPIHAFGSRSSIRDDISLLPDLSGTAQHKHGASHSKTDATAAAAARTREFPLYLPRGGSTAAQFRFDYAWFLLNKDIEILCAAHGLRLVDIRQTLPNLQYLLYVCSAGSDDLPERKRGGVRGLLAGRFPASSHVGRTSSSASLSALGSPAPSVAAGSPPPHPGSPAAAAAAGRPLSPASEDAGASRRGSLDSDGMAMAMAMARREGDLRRVAMRRRGDGDDAASEDGGSSSPRFVLPFSEGETKLTLRTKGMRENIAG